MECEDTQELNEQGNSQTVQETDAHFLKEGKEQGEHCTERRKKQKIQRIPERVQGNLGKGRQVESEVSVKFVKSGNLRNG